MSRRWAALPAQQQSGMRGRGWRRLHAGRVRRWAAGQRCCAACKADDGARHLGLRHCMRGGPGWSRHRAPGPSAHGAGRAPRLSTSKARHKHTGLLPRWGNFCTPAGWAALFRCPPRRLTLRKVGSQGGTGGDGAQRRAGGGRGGCHGRECCRDIGGPAMCLGISACLKSSVSTPQWQPAASWLCCAGQDQHFLKCMRSQDCTAVRTRSVGTLVLHQRVVLDDRGQAMASLQPRSGGGNQSPHGELGMAGRRRRRGSCTRVGAGKQRLHREGAVSAALEPSGEGKAQPAAVPASEASRTRGLEVERTEACSAQADAPTGAKSATRVITRRDAAGSSKMQGTWGEGT